MNQIPSHYYENLDAVPKSSGSMAVYETNDNHTDYPSAVNEPYVNISITENRTKGEEETSDRSQTKDEEHYQKLQTTENTNIGSPYDQLY